jgi:hypothetical protein
MATTQLQLRRGNTASISAFTGALAEVIYDTDEKTLVVQDGSTSGGFYLAQREEANAAFNLANSANVLAQSAYDSGNATLTYATSSFNLANAANVLAQSAYANGNNTLVLVQSAYANGNNTFTFSQSAYNVANSSNMVAFSAFDKANTAYTDATNAYNFATDINVYAYSAYSQANSAKILAQAAFDSGNSTITYATAGFDKANTANVTAQAAFDSGNSTLTYVTSGYGKANGAFDKANSANVLAQSAYDSGNTTLTYATAGFNKANTANVTGQAAFDFANSVNTYAFSAYAQGNSTLTYATSGYGKANGAFDKANNANVTAQAAFDSGNSTLTYATAGFDKANAANVLAQQAYDTANGKLSLSGGTITGSVNFTANVVADLINANSHIIGGAFNGDEEESSIKVNGHNYTSKLVVADINDENIAQVLLHRHSTEWEPILASARSNSDTTEHVDVTNGQNVLSIYGTGSAGADYKIFGGISIAVDNGGTVSNTSSPGQIIFLTTPDGSVLPQSALVLANDATATFTSGVYAPAIIANGTDLSVFSQSAYDEANAANVLAQSAYNTANTKFSSSGGTISGNTTINGDLTVSGNISYTGNVISTTISGNTGEFFGYTSNGFNALYAGIPTGYLVEDQMISQFTANYNGYAGVNHQNINNGTLSSVDAFFTPNNGSSNDTFLDLGMASSTYSYPGYTIITPNDAYLIAYGNTITGGGNMIISTGLSNDIIFTTGGVNVENEMARFKNGVGLVMKNMPITFADSTSQNTAAAPYAYSNAAYSLANSTLTYATAGFDKANTANVTAQAAFNFANSVNTYASAAYANGNNTLQYAQSAYAFANSVNNYAFAAYANGNNTLQFAQAGFNLANTGNVLAQAAFNKANGAVQTAFVTVSANGNSITPSSNNDTLTITAATANGINVLNPSSKTIDIGLRTSGVTAGSYGNTTSIPSITVDTFGRVTSVSNNTIYVPPGTSIVANSGQLTANASTGIVALGLDTTAVSAGTYGGSTQIPVITVDSYGRLTSASNTSVSTTINLSGTTGSGSVSGGGTLTFSSNNGIVVSATGGSTLYINSPQNLQTTASPSFVAATLNTSGYITSTAFTTSSTSQVTVDSFATTTYRSAHYFAQMTSGSSYHIIEMNVLHDGTNPLLDQYGEIFTGSSLGSFDVSISTGNFNLLFTPTNAATTVKLVRTNITV